MQYSQSDWQDIPNCLRFISLIIESKFSAVTVLFLGLWILSKVQLVGFFEQSLPVLKVTKSVWIIH